MLKSYVVEDAVESSTDRKPFFIIRPYVTCHCQFLFELSIN